LPDLQFGETDHTDVAGVPSESPVTFRRARPHACVAWFLRVRGSISLTCTGAFS